MTPTPDSPTGRDLTINGESRAVPLPCTVRELLRTLELEGSRVAVAVNRGVVPRSTFDSQWLEAGDRVEILEAVGGG